MEKFKSGFVTIIGRPNVGKSTLLNLIMGEKLSIVSSKPQTTRNKIQAIMTTETSQIIFLDTPGIHKPKNKLGEYMTKIANNTVKEVDAVLYLVTPDEEIGVGDSHIIEQLKNISMSTPVILVINKIDSVKKESVVKTIDTFSKAYSFSEVVPISALKGENVDTLIKILESKLPLGPLYFPADMITDQPEKTIVSEIIREKILRNLEQEIPHGTAVSIDSMKKSTESELIDIGATIYCEKDSHKAIIIGKGGAMLKKIGHESRIDIHFLIFC
jgi:GTP-binding protein Era